MTIFEKLKQARLILQLTQNELSKLVEMSQKDVSLLEKGKREFIPIRYIRFLLSKKIDINSLFEDNQEIKMIETNKNENNLSISNKELEIELKNKNIIINALLKEIKAKEE